MAALDLTTLTTLPAVRNNTLEAVAGNVRQILLPSQPRHVRISLQTRSGTLKLVSADAGLADGGAIGATAYLTVAALSLIEVQTGALPDGGLVRAASVFVASTANSDVLEVIIERSSR